MRVKGSDTMRALAALIVVAPFTYYVQNGGQPRITEKNPARHNWLQGFVYRMGLRRVELPTSR